jgi:molybdopterin converting factor small subunit
MLTISVSYGLEQNAQVLVEEGTTITQVLAMVRGALRFGGNVKALIDGVNQPLDNTVRDGDSIEVETAANCKASDLSVTVKYGLESSITVSVSEGTTIKEVLDRVRDALRFGSNVKALVDGAAQPLENNVADGDVIQVETAANSKAE